MSEPIHFGWFVGQGFGVQGWRKDSSRWGYRWYQPDIWEQAARVLEQAGFDFLLLKDGPVFTGTEASRRIGLASAEAAPRHEPLLLVPLLLRATTHLGIVPTLNSSHYDPYIAARQIATLAHLDTPRVGLNVVTSGGPNALENFSLFDEQLDSRGTYDRATEWITIVKQLWQSWDRDAVIEDEAGRVYALAERTRRIDFSGEFFDVAGPGVSLPFQDDGPLIVAPSNSPRGLQFVGEHGDVQFGYATKPEHIARIRSGIDGASRPDGRDPREVKVFTAISPKVVGSRAEKEEYLSWRRSDESLLRELPLLSVILDYDLTTLDFDEPLPRELHEQWTSNPVSAGVVGAFLSTVDDPETAPFRELAARSTHGQSGDIVGTAEEIADHVEELVDTTALDGVLFDFNVDPESLFGTLVPLVPVLRRRGLLRTEYGSTSLRENLNEF
ncbi:NtaA/DmoA family FMN-dependent monooxygenase [Leucobacter weissii]|uniref:NtaA/DmoA family FMN-dependent monooxygenase n=1 Tax=Leucobacter weissii TaxID=1983706 RepID=A0A939MMZ8_9MICO|nr:NtaA/DmoA family FMN-dependent monooxygenase [Leucobacter weissii]MBO1901772.1 NtaA/DmoA family FMN-dependent monooxygenase [Leucobacter weissii]